MLKTITKAVRDKYEMVAGLSTLAALLVMLGATVVVQGLGVVTKDHIQRLGAKHGYQEEGRQVQVQAKDQD